ncbi:MAG: cytochrome c [Deltaproteobacteria bacterium]|nr:cytochrome c [Deltaproteobacteria bacterium]
MSLAADLPRADAQRLFQLLRGVEQEYREACAEDGTLIRPLDLEEARLLVAAARQRVEPLAVEEWGEVGRKLQELSGAVDARAAASIVAAQVRDLRDEVRRASGVADDPLPPALPSAARGAILYKENCVSCHGERGAGDGPDAAGLDPQPTNFTDPVFMRQQTPADFFLVISLGRRRSAMAAWDDALSVQERWDLVSFLLTLDAAAKEGDALDAALSRVGQGVESAVDAYRLANPEAAELAADAYLVFESLEREIAALQPSAVEGVEAAFVRLERALRQPGAIKEVEGSGVAVERALEQATRAADPSSRRPPPTLVRAILLIVVAGLFAALFTAGRAKTRGENQNPPFD